MLRMLIVDDEPIIADGLLALFEEVSDGSFELCRAYSGGDAIREMLKGRVDILLTDISMPDMSGLDLQKTFLRQWPHGKVIFLTGFSDFGYVQEAIRSGSVDYVLKTEGDDAILKAVDNAVEKILEDVKTLERLSQAEVDRRDYLSILLGKLIQDLMSPSPMSQEEKRNLFAELAVPLDGSMPVQLLLGRVGSSNAETGSYRRMKGLMDVQEAGKQLLSVSSNVVSLLMEEDAILWLVQPRMEGKEAEETAWTRLSLFLKGCMGPLQQLGESISGNPLMMAVGEDASTWAEIGPSCERLSAALRTAGSLSYEALVVVGSPSEQEAIACGDPDHGSMNRAVRQKNLMRRIPMMRSLLDNGQFKELGAELYAAGMFLDVYVPMGTVAARELMLSLSVMFLSYINELNVQDTETARKLAEQVGDRFLSNGGMTYTQIFQRILQILSEHRQNRDLRDVNQILQLVRNHVHDHLNGDLSLTRMAGLLHFNPSYFSRLFKNITDIGYAEYVAGVRMEKAKELLVKSQLAINRVGELIGYEEPSNFTRFFRKHSLATPQEYRNLCANENE